MEIPQQRLFSNRRLVKLIIPLIIEQAMAILIGLVDGIMVSVVSEEAMSGVSLVNNLTNVILTLFAGLSTGGAVLTSQFLGAKDKEKARQSAGQMVILAISISAFMMLVCVTLNRHILHLFFGAVEKPVMDAAITYFFYNAISFPVIALYNVGAAIHRSQGNSKVPMKISLVKNTVNIVFNAVCIYGLHMGVEGVAIPTLLSRLVGAVFILLPLFKPGQEIHLKLSHLRKVKWDMLGKIVKIGIPASLENSLTHFGRVLILGMITPFGTIHTAANAATANISNFAIVVPGAIRLALITIAGQCIGAHDIPQAKYYTKRLMKWAYAITGAVVCVVFLLRSQLLSLYPTLSPETVELTKKLIAIDLSGMAVFYSLAFTLTGTLRAGNDGTFIMTVSLTSLVVIRLGLSWLLCTYLGWGVVGVFVSMITDWAVRGILNLIRYLSGTWEKKAYLT